MKFKYQFFTLVQNIYNAYFPFHSDILYFFLLKMWMKYNPKNPYPLFEFVETPPHFYYVGGLTYITNKLFISSFFSSYLFIHKINLIENKGKSWIFSINILFFFFDFFCKLYFRSIKFIHSLFLMAINTWFFFIRH